MGDTCILYRRLGHKDCGDVSHGFATYLASASLIIASNCLRSDAVRSARTGSGGGAESRGSDTLAAWSRGPSPEHGGGRGFDLLSTADAEAYSSSAVAEEYVRSTMIFGGRGGVHP